MKPKNSSMADERLQNRDKNEGGSGCSEEPSDNDYNK